MKKYLTLFALVFIAASCSFSFNSGVSLMGEYTEEGIDYSEERTPGVFTEVLVKGPFNAYFVQSPQTKVLVEGDRESVGKTVTVSDNGILTVKLKDGVYQNLVLRVTVFAPDVRRLSTAGSGDLVLTTDVVASEGLELESCGSGDIKSSGSIFSAAGLSISTAGSGDVELKNVEIQGDLDVKSAGSGSVEVNGCCRNVIAKTAGSGTISGNLKFDDISSSSAGSGEVIFNGRAATASGLKVGL